MTFLKPECKRMIVKRDAKLHSNNIFGNKRTFWITLLLLCAVFAILAVLGTTLLNSAFVKQFMNMSGHSSKSAVTMSVIEPIIYTCLCFQLFFGLPGNLREAFDSWNLMRNSLVEHEEAKVKKTTYLGAWLLFLSDIFQIILALLLIAFAVMAWHLTDDPFSIVRVISGEL